MTRINKFLADCGVASRRAAEDLIRFGKVKVNGETVTDLGTRIADTDTVTVNNKPITRQSRMVYIMLNKPMGVVTTCSDQFDRKTVLDIIEGVPERLHTVGRLDYDTEGLLLLTNDGQFTAHVTHPSNQIPKTYIATLHAPIAPDQIKQLREGAGYNPPQHVSVSKLDVTITISEGRNRQVRKMFENIGSHVITLKRIQVGNLTLGKLKPGEWRYMTDEEVKSFANSQKK